MKKICMCVMAIVLACCVLAGSVSAFAGDWDTEPVCINHVFARELVEPATAAQDGYTAIRCKTCKELQGDGSKIIIPRIASVTLSQTQFDYTGKAHTPKVTVKDRAGNVISTGNYDVKYVNNTVVGKKTYANIVFKGYYQAAYNRYFTISLTKPSVSVKTGANAVALSWKKVPGATYYRVYQYNAAKQSYTRIANTNQLSYTMKNKAAGTTYYYLVRAYFINAAKKEVLSPYTTADNVKAVTLCAAPRVSASVSGKTVTLKWAKVSGAKYYRVFRYDAKTGKYTGLVNGYTATTYSVKNQAKGTHYYLVRAFNAAGAGSAYNTKILAKATVK